MKKRFRKPKYDINFWRVVIVLLWVIVKIAAFIVNAIIWNKMDKTNYETKSLIQILIEIFVKSSDNATYDDQHYKYNQSQQKLWKIYFILVTLSMILTLFAIFLDFKEYKFGLAVKILVFGLEIAMFAMIIKRYNKPVNKDVVYRSLGLTLIQIIIIIALIFGPYYPDWAVFF